MSIILISELFIIESDWNLEKVNVVHVDSHFDCRKTVVLLQCPKNPRQLRGLSRGMPLGVMMVTDCFAGCRCIVK